MSREHSEAVVTVYKCVNPKCGRTDRDRGFNPPAPASLICFEKSCRSEMLPCDPAEYRETRPLVNITA